MSRERTEQRKERTPGPLDQFHLRNEDTVKTTGLSSYYIRRGIRDGSIPHIKSGSKYLVNVVRLLESLDALPAKRGVMAWQLN